ncbi:MAG: EscU/YscU/HrcU family type III secretion system export apparatus switch protein [Legionellaceae bacterium]|nr:EscU/YscU/HrcU family type III secretion system export apparatus switch protein [Legionellaceae bacterium]
MEKTEKATRYKLDKAREKGQVAKSAEWISAITLLCTLVMLRAFWQTDWQQLQIEMRHLLMASGHFHFSLSNLVHLMQHILMYLLGLFVPLAMALILAASLASLMQTGFIWSPEALKPDLKRLHLMQSLRRFFSIKLLFDSGKNSLKFISALILLSLSFYTLLPKLHPLLQQHPTTYANQLLALFFRLGMQLFVLLCVFAMLDVLFSRWKFGRDQRMSKQEVKDEHKQREGDPKIKAKIKQLQRELRARTASIQQVKTADVIITNPSHIAVALQYKRGQMPAPKVVCKVSGDLVALVKQKARQHGIVMIENKSFARALFHSVRLNHYIDAHFFPVAAAIFKQIMTQECGGKA